MGKRQRQLKALDENFGMLKKLRPEQIKTFDKAVTKRMKAVKERTWLIIDGILFLLLIAEGAISLFVEGGLTRVLP